MAMKTMHIGLDDTDSIRRGCTTYIAALLVENLQSLGVEFIDYPNLIRLNPNVPWKTRGNGALCIRIKHDANLEERIKEAVVGVVEEHADLESEGTDPGMVFFEGARIPREVGVFAKNAITTVVSLEDAMRILRRFNAEALGFKKGRGIIGSLAAIGETLRGDHTFEILAYRSNRNCGFKRKVDEKSIFDMDKATAPYTFNNVDLEKHRVVITPRGPDPILFGIRGESAEMVKKAFGIVRSLEEVERWVVFRTNQGTDAHFRRIENLSQAKPYMSIIARGSVSKNPKMIPRRHVIFSIKDRYREVDCAAYEPTGALRKAAIKLLSGDLMEVYGSVRAPSKGRPLTINLEKMQLLRLAPRVTYHNPICAKCGKRLKSMGKGQGFRCERCSSKYADLEKVAVEVEREIGEGLYLTSTRSQRHLTKPLRRYGMEKQYGRVEELIEGWHFP